jgi:hypothetical protein
MPLPSDPKVIFLGGLFVLALLAAANVASEIVLPLVFAIVLKLLLQPALRVLERLHVPRILAAMLLILALFGTIVGLGTAISGPARTWAAKLPEGCPTLSGGDHFLLYDRHGILEGLHRGLAEAPASLMWARLVVVGEAPRLGGLENTMTTEQKIIRAKVGLLELAQAARQEETSRVDWVGPNCAMRVSGEHDCNGIGQTVKRSPFHQQRGIGIGFLLRAASGSAEIPIIAIGSTDAYLRALNFSRSHIKRRRRTHLAG